MEFKFLVALLLTPLANPVLTFYLKTTGQNESKLDAVRTSFQFYLCLFMYVYSTLIKYVREEVCNNLQQDPLLDKVDLIKEQLGKQK